MHANSANLQFESSDEVKVAPTFVRWWRVCGLTAQDSLGLKDDLLRGIYAYSACLQRARANGRL